MSRYSRGPSWHTIRYFAESSLNHRFGNGADIRVEGKIGRCGQGIFHDNYEFEASGRFEPDERESRSFVLRLPQRRSAFESDAEAQTSLKNEARTLETLESQDFPFDAPEFICPVFELEETRSRTKKTAQPWSGFIESWLPGAQLEFWKDSNFLPLPLTEIIAKVAAAVHALPTQAFSHLPSHPDTHTHIQSELFGVEKEVYARFQGAALAREWVTRHMGENRPSALLHGDLLPQNLLWYIDAPNTVSVVDWHGANIGDPALDLAIVIQHRGKALNKSGGLAKLVETYNDQASAPISHEAVQVHQVLMVLRWLASAHRDRLKGDAGGHGPEHYEQKILSMLRRF